MIPKIIHYCWFGGNPLPELAVKCIESWKKFCPGYEIIQWDESNFDLNCCEYVKEAYTAKKWAFVSDYARYFILYKYGGLYFDTDVEFVKNIDDLILKGPFMGLEKNVNIAVAPGLGMAAKPGLGIYKEVLDFYDKHHFLYSDGSINQTTVCKYTTDILVKYGLKLEDKEQYIGGIYVYPSDYFCPLHYDTGELFLTENSRTIHHYTSAWFNSEEKKIKKITQSLIGKYGKEKGMKIAKIICKPYRIKMHLRTKGIRGTILFAFQKLRNYKSVIVADDR